MRKRAENTGAPYEIMLAEVKNASDVSAVEKVFQDRIDSAAEGGCTSGRHE